MGNLVGRFSNRGIGVRLSFEVGWEDQMVAFDGRLGKKTQTEAELDRCVQSTALSRHTDRHFRSVLSDCAVAHILPRLPDDSVDELID